LARGDAQKGVFSLVFFGGGKRKFIFDTIAQYTPIVFSEERCTRHKFKADIVVDLLGMIGILPATLSA